MCFFAHDASQLERLVERARQRHYADESIPLVGGEGVQGISAEDPVGVLPIAGFVIVLPVEVALHEGPSRRWQLLAQRDLTVTPHYIKRIVGSVPLRALLKLHP
jgi:hypothetical protein